MTKSVYKPRVWPCHSARDGGDNDMVTYKDHTAHSVGGSYSRISPLSPSKAHCSRQSLTSTETVDRDQVGVHQVVATGGLRMKDSSQIPAIVSVEVGISHSD